MRDSIIGEYTIRNLFHGINGSTFLPFNRWIKAEKKMVKDGSGGREYLSGIHCFKEYETAKKYLKKFKYSSIKRIIQIEAMGLRQKPTNPDVWLADQIYIPHPMC